MAEITLGNMYKRYNNAEDYAVKDFNLEVEDNEFNVFVRPSGCGKSTTLRMIAVVDEQDYHEPGPTLEVTFNMNKTHFFDEETENVIKKTRP